MPETIADLWRKDKNTLFGKTLAQILSFSGDGKLRDNSQTSLEIREFFDLIPTDQLAVYIDECVSNPFDASGYALQDLVNELGKRLGFSVEPGLYQGKRNAIGHDGLWLSDTHDIVVEVKTTDTFLYSVDVIATYRRKLIEANAIIGDTSSILMVVGRKDTDGLEAQIRGSKHAWDIRLISVDALLKLLRIKEELLDDESTFQRICQVLKPMEFTRLDYLVDIIFSTGRDSQIIDETDEHQDLIEDNHTQKPVAFYDDCITVLQNQLHASLKKQMKTLYTNREENIGLSCAVSKQYGDSPNALFWFAFHPSQKIFLAKYDRAYVCFGCGSAQTLFMFTYDTFISYLDKMSETTRNGRHYWHVKIQQRENRYLLLRGNSDHIDITDALVYS